MVKPLNPNDGTKPVDLSKETRNQGDLLARMGKISKSAISLGVGTLVAGIVVGATLGVALLAGAVIITAATIATAIALPITGTLLTVLLIAGAVLYTKESSPTQKTTPKPSPPLDVTKQVELTRPAPSAEKITNTFGDIYYSFRRGDEKIYQSADSFSSAINSDCQGFVPGVKTMNALLSADGRMELVSNALGDEFEINRLANTTSTITVTSVSEDRLDVLVQEIVEVKDTHGKLIQTHQLQIQWNSEEGPAEVLIKLAPIIPK